MTKYGQKHFVKTRLVYLTGFAWYTVRSFGVTPPKTLTQKPLTFGSERHVRAAHMHSCYRYCFHLSQKHVEDGDMVANLMGCLLHWCLHSIDETGQSV